MALSVAKGEVAMAVAESLYACLDDNWGGRSVCRALARRILAVASRRVGLVAAALVTVAALGFPSQARAGDAPGRLTDNVEAIAREHCDGPVVWARYVATSADAAARLLGKSPRQLQEGTPDRVYLVVMRGDFSKGRSDFSRDYAGARRGPYLAFLYWHDGDYWNVSDFTLLRRPVPMESAGVPRTIESFALAHPSLQRASEYALLGLVFFGPAVLLLVCAVLCAWRRRSAWPYVLAACVAVAVACWQVFGALMSVSSELSGQPWDPAFHGFKFAVLAVVVGVDLTAAVVAWQARPRAEAASRTSASRVAVNSAGVAWLVLAAALYVVSWYFVASSGE